MKISKERGIAVGFMQTSRPYGCFKGDMSSKIYFPIKKEKNKIRTKGRQDVRWDVKCYCQRWRRILVWANQRRSI